MQCFAVVGGYVCKNTRNTTLQASFYSAMYDVERDWVLANRTMKMVAASGDRSTLENV